MNRGVLLAGLVATLMVAPPMPSWGQNYPGKVIRVVTTDVGSNLDIVARTTSLALSPLLGQPLIVQNRAGLLAIDTVTKSIPDGHTVLMLGTAVWIVPLMQKTTYDAQKDLAPITLLANAPLFLFTHPSLPAKTVKELIAVAKARPGELNYGMAGAGTSNHLAAELFKQMAGVNIVTVAFKGSGQAMANLMTNQLQMVFSSAPTGLPHVATGRLRVLGVASAKPSVLAPDVPTMASSGLPGFEVTSRIGMWVPAGTPRDIVDRLNRETLKVLASADLKEKFLANATETVGGSPQETVAFIRTESAKWRKLVEDARLRVD